jgi:phosphoribosylanthranilate isomerase
MMMIKVCGITRREDAVAAAEAGASALGFIFYPKSPRYVAPERAAELGDGLPVWKVGVFVDETPAAIEAAIRAARLDIVQIYGDASPDGARVWRAFRMVSGFGALATEGAEAILMDGPANGVSFDWARARNAAEKVIVAGGLDASNVAEAIRTAQPWGVDASSRLETAPGIKDHEKVRAFVEAARKAGEQTS